MGTEKDVGRDAKKTGILVAGIAFAILAAGYLLISWANTPPAQPSRINVDRVSGGTGTAAQETQQYRDLLKESNEAGAAHALNTNGSFIASISMAEHEPEPPSTPAPVPAARQPQVQVKEHTQYGQSGLDPEKKKAVESYLLELISQRKPASGRSASIAGGAEVQGATGNTSTWTAWTDSLKPAAQVTVTSPQPEAKAQVMIPAGSRTGGVIDTEVDSDNSRTQVLASIPAGPYAGATLMANGVQLAGDGVSINFNRMQWKGDTWNVDVWAAMPDTLRSSVATTVNNRYLSRIILPSLANGVGLTGQLYASANTQILSNGYNNLEGRVGMPDSKAVTGTIIGGTAQHAGQVIATDAQRLPVKQVLVERGQPVALIFMKAVNTTDNLTRSALSEQAPSLLTNQQMDPR